MKTFTAGERLFASDLNDNFDETKTAENITSGTIDAARLPAIGPVFSTAGSNTVALDFSGDSIITRSASGSVTFTGTDYTSGRSATIRIVAGGSSRNLTFPADWKFVSLKPSALEANQTGILSVTCFGSSATDVAAAWAWSV
jgi:hypothetical protein